VAAGSQYRLDRDDLIERLRAQRDFLTRSARAFDDGAEDEAVRLAATIRVLLYDTPGPTTSLLTHLGVKDRITYVDTASPIDPRNLAPTPGLVMMRMSNEGASYVPVLDNFSGQHSHPNKPFRAWWEDPVTKDGHGNYFSRKDYILTAANKEGGAHVDHSLDARYQALARDNALGWMSFTPADDQGKPFDRNPAYASVRQIAFEVERTFAQHPLKLGLAS
jgi:hypothetical protein